MYTIQISLSKVKYIKKYKFQPKMVAFSYLSSWSTPILEILMRVLCENDKFKLKKKINK